MIEKDFMRIMSEPVEDNSPVILGWKLRGVICGEDGEPARMLFQKKDHVDREFSLK